MNKISFKIENHEIQLAVDSVGKEYVYYDNVIVSETLSIFKPSSTHHFEAIENGKTTKYDVTFRPTLSLLAQCVVKRNNVVVKKDVISSLTPGLLRIYFFFFSLAYLILPILAFLITPRSSYDNLSISRYDLNYLTLLYGDFGTVGIAFVFGILFLSFAFLLITILVKLPNLVTTVLWIRIGLMIASSPWAIAKLIQSQPFLSDKLYETVALRVATIWFCWFLLENSKAVSKMLKSHGTE